MAFNAASFRPRAFKSSTMCTFTGTPGTAVIEMGESEATPGGRSFVRGVRPFIDVTANAVTVAIGHRDHPQASVTYTSEVTANSRSGVCGFRNDARYQRVRLTIAGTFNSAQAVDVDAVPSGKT
jgi:hypothetical protein